MFSDVVADCLTDIEKALLRPNYAMREVYPRSAVIDMISSMLFVQYHSDFVPLGMTEAGIRALARKNAEDTYAQAMDNRLQDSARKTGARCSKKRKTASAMTTVGQDDAQGT